MSLGKLRLVLNFVNISESQSIGVVIEGQSTLDSLYKGYGDIPPFGNGPDQTELHIQGNAYIRNLFPNIDFIHSCEVVVTSLEGETVEEDKEQIHQLEELEHEAVAEEADSGFIEEKDIDDKVSD